MKEFNGVEDTLFIPLVSRIYASKNFSEFFYDSKALELEKYISNNSIKNNTGEYFTMASVARFYELDNLVKKFINKYINCNVVVLGCGLETMSYRVNDSRATFYEIDFESVIESRKKYLGKLKNEILISSDILDFSWIEKINTNKPTLIIACGVFQYLHKENILELIKVIKDKLTNVELAFDATNKQGVRGAIKYVKKTGNKDAMMYFYVNKIDEFIKKSNTSLIKVIPFYKNSSKILKNKLKLSTKFNCYFGDKLGFTKIIYLKVK